MNPLSLLTKWFANSRPRPARVRRTGRLSLEALDGRILPSTTAVLVRDINPASSALSMPSSNPQQMTNFNGSLFFTADDGIHGRELWKTDGTAAGTVLVRDIRLGAAGSDIWEMTVVGSTLFFTANDGFNGTELWKSDGTTTGTRMVVNIRAGAQGSNPSSLTAVGSTLFFRADDGLAGQELWKSDGSTSGTVMVRDILSGVYGSEPQYLTALGSTLFFTVQIPGVDTWELWRSDGTTAGTVDTTLWTGGIWGSDFYAYLTVSGSSLYFVAPGPGSGPRYPTLEMTNEARTVSPISGIPHANVSIQDLVDVNGSLFFTLHGPTAAESGLYEVRGTSAVLITDFSRFSHYPNEFKAVNGTLFFAAGENSHPDSLWKYDGNAVVEVADFDARTSSTYFSMTNVDGTLYLSVDDGLSGQELWQTDGTAAGTRMVRNINPAGSSSPSWFVGFHGDMYFAADDGSSGTELWKTRANTAPSVTPLAPSYGLREGTATSILTAYSDADGDAVTFSAAGLPAGLSINPNTGIIAGTLAYSAGRPTPYTVTVTGSDGFESSSVSFALTVLDVTPPTIVNPGAQTSNENTVASLAIHASDPNGDVLTYSAKGLPPGLSINASTGLISGTLGWQSGGTYHVTVTVSDGTNLVSTHFDWTVRDLTPPAVATPRAQRSFRGNSINLAIIASDAEGDPLTYSAVNLPLGLSINRTTGRISGTISASALSSYSVTIRVSDGTNTSSVTFLWMVA